MPKRKRYQASSSSDSDSEYQESEDDAECSLGSSASSFQPTSASESDTDPESESSDWEAETKSKTKKGTVKKGSPRKKRGPTPGKKKGTKKTSTTEKEPSSRCTRTCIRKITCEFRKFPDNEVTGTLLEMDGHIFKKKKEVKSTRTWRCQAWKRATCRVRFVTVGSELTRYSFRDGQPLEHNHPPPTGYHRKCILEGKLYFRSKRTCRPENLHKMTGEVRKFQDDEVTHNCLVMDGYVLRKKKEVGTTRTWVCPRKKCEVRIMTVHNELTHCALKNNEPVQHTHPPPTAKRRDRMVKGKHVFNNQVYHCPSTIFEKWPEHGEFISKCLKRSEEDFATSLIQIYESESHQFLGRNTKKAIKENMPKYSDLGPAMVHKRNGAKESIKRKGKRGNPVSYNRLKLKKEDSTTYTGEPFLIADESYNWKRLLVFASKEGLQVLAKSAIIYLDGTYDAPRLFEQIYTIHVMPQNGILLPVVYALLPDRTLETYLKFLESLVTNCGNLGLQLCPVRVQTGFEDEMLTAIQQIWPLSELSCSHYFYTHSIVRGLEDVGLQRQYAKAGNASLYSMCYRLIALPLVPPDEVKTLAEHVFTIFGNAIPPTVQQLKWLNFKNWFQTTWQDKHPVAVWNHYEKMGPRMNAYLEEWHKKVKDVLQNYFHSIYELIALLRLEESINRLRVEQAATDQYPRGRYHPYIVASKRLQKLRSDLEKEELTSKKYLKRVAELPEIKAVSIHFTKNLYLVDPAN